MASEILNLSKTQIKSMIDLNTGNCNLHIMVISRLLTCLEEERSDSHIIFDCEALMRDTDLKD